jgi:hypothetical protein
MTPVKIFAGRRSLPFLQGCGTLQISQVLARFEPFSTKFTGKLFSTVRNP